MDFINNYYFNAFRKSFDYKSFTQRKEFNFFFLFYVIVSILCFFIFFINQAYLIATTATTQTVMNAIKIFYGVMIIVAIIHIFPLLALIKRRYNDISPSKSKLFFGIYLSVWILQMSVGFTMMLFTYIYQDKLNIIFYVMLAAFIQLCNIFMMINWIFLMAKKGSAPIVKPENPPIFPVENL